MNVLIDTCIFVRNDQNQTKVPGFNYEELENLLADKSNSVFVSCFSLPEIYMLRKYSDTDDLFADLASQTTFVAEYNCSTLSIDFSKFDIINKYAAIMFYHLTSFLEFFVLEVTQSFDLDEIGSFHKVVYDCTEKFHKDIGETNLKNCTVFMKEKAVDYIVSCIQMVFDHYGKTYSKYEIWKIVAESKIGSFLARDVDIRYLRYGRFLKHLFESKILNKAKKIKLKFGFNDLLIAHATDSDFVVITSDKDMSRYLLKYGSNNNKLIISKLWNESLKPAEY